jgi:hypothetical protein
MTRLVPAGGGYGAPELWGGRSVREKDFAGRFLKLGPVVIMSAGELGLAPVTIHNAFVAHLKDRAGRLMDEAVAVNLELAMIDFHVHALRTAGY